MSQNRFNTIVIIDCIPEGELNTARQLRDDVEILAAAYANEFNVKMIRVDHHSDLVLCMSEILKNLHDKGQFPLIHLEAHGLDSENGFQLANGSSCSWKQLKDLITPINVASGLNLLIIMAACHGGSFSKAIMATDRAPLWGLIGPKFPLSAEQVQADFTKFYRTFFETGSGGQAVSTLNNNDPEGMYFKTNAIDWFYDVWRNYKKNFCTEQKIRERARVLYRKAKTNKLAKIPSVGCFIRRIKGSDQSAFEKFRDIYFMYDLYAVNRERFPVSYKQVSNLP